MLDQKVGQKQLCVYIITTILSSTSLILDRFTQVSALGSYSPLGFFSLTEGNQRTNSLEKCIKFCVTGLGYDRM